MNRPRKLVPLSIAVSLVACAQQAKAPVDDDFSQFAGLDEKSDAFSYRMKTLGSLGYGETSSAAYSKTPRFRAYTFEGNAGDRVDAWVRSTDGGDAVAWLLDKSFRVVASNDDAADDTLDAHVAVTLPASASTTHYLVYRDYDLHTAHFTAELGGGPAWDTTCQRDSDCVAVSKGGCCPNGTNVAVSLGAETDYATANACTVTPHPVCPFAVILDRRVAECSHVTNHCEMVAPEDIACGGNLATAHACPDGYTCQLVVGHADRPGRCVAQ